MSENFFGGFQNSGGYEADNAFQSSVIVQSLGPSIIVFLPENTHNQVPQDTDYYCNIMYLDINGDPIIPISVQWQLYDATNLNLLQNWTPVTSPLTQSSTVHIPASFNALGNPKSLVETRKIIFWITASGGGERYDNGVYYVLSVPSVP